MPATRTARPDLDDNAAIWLAGAPPYTPLPALAGDVDADLAVIGGGFTGVSTAYEVSRRFPERRVVLLEAKSLGNGASGRNGGLMLNWVNGVHPREPETARRIFGVTANGIDGIEAIVRRHGLDVRMARNGALEVYTHPRWAEAAHAHAEKLASWGLPIRWLAGDELRAHVRVEGAVGAALDPTAGRLNGVDYVRALRPVLVAQGVHVHEGTPVLRIEEGATCALHTPGGVVRARAIVLATNAYTPRLGYFRNAVVPLHSHVLATEPVPEEAWARSGWGDHAGFSDDLDRIAYGSRTADGRVVFGGGSNAAYEYLYGGGTSWPAGNPATQAWRAIERRLATYLPAVAAVGVAARWTGPVAITLDRRPSIGVRGDHHNVYFALGYCGHGVTLGNLAGRILCDLYAGDDAPWRDLPFVHHRIPYTPPDPFRWIGYQAYTRATGRSPRVVG